jgi:hypothetical protein
MISDEEAEAIKAMRQAYDRLKELGWDDIARFKPVMKSFGSVPFLGIEVGSRRPIVCEYNSKNSKGERPFVSLDSDDKPKREDDTVFFMSNSEEEPANNPDRVHLIMFRHYKS